MAMETYAKHNNEGLRMIAVAQKFEAPAAGKFTVQDETDMILLGFIGFLDPPKESAGIAIETLKKHGVRTVVLTGDSEGVAIKVCGKVGIDVRNCLTGKRVEAMSDKELLDSLDNCSLFSKLSPAQKERVVKAYQTKGHTVGYMGDGINDAPPMHQADVSISVDSAVDIAKETADIILLKKDLMVLKEGVIEGRRTFGNIIKYIKMASSGNFGNIFSILVSSVFLPFLPMLPVQILCQNLICDFSQLGIPFDHTDKEYIEKPHKWETKSIKSFMYCMGPLSSIFDILCFIVLWFVLGANTKDMAPLFQCGWFVFGTMSQVFIIHTVRTEKIPFFQSIASKALCLSTIVVALIPLLIGFTSMAGALDMQTLPLVYLPLLFGLMIIYSFVAQLVKKAYIKKFGSWL
jgi:Mg2+-importing ATPase